MNIWCTLLQEFVFHQFLQLCVRALLFSTAIFFRKSNFKSNRLHLESNRNCNRLPRQKCNCNVIDYFFRPSNCNVIDYISKVIWPCLIFKHCVKRFTQRVPINAHFSCPKTFFCKKKGCKKVSSFWKQRKRRHGQSIKLEKCVTSNLFQSSFFLQCCDMTVESHSIAVRVILLLAIWWQQEEGL